MLLYFVFIVLVRACRVGICYSVFILLLYRSSLSMEISRLTRDGTAEPVSRDQILRREHGQGNKISPVQLTTCRNGNLNRLIHTHSSFYMCDHTLYIYTYIVVVVVLVIVLSARELSTASLALFFIS